MAAPPTPVPSVSNRTLVAPLAAPSHVSARSAAWPSLKTGTGSLKPSHFCQLRFSRPCKRSGIVAMDRPSRAGNPGAATPTLVSLGNPERIFLATSRARFSHDFVPSSAVGCVSCARILPVGVNATHLVFVPPTSRPMNVVGPLIRVSLRFSARELSFADAPTAINGEDFPGGEFGSVAHEINSRGVEVCRLADAATVQRLFGLDKRQNFTVTGGAASHRRLHQRRCDDITPNTSRRVIG